MFHVKQEDVFRWTVTDYIGGGGKVVFDPQMDGSDWWLGSSRLPIKRVAWGRRPRPSISPRALLSQNSERCSSTAILRATRPAALGSTASGYREPCITRSLANAPLQRSFSGASSSRTSTSPRQHRISQELRSSWSIVRGGSCQCARRLHPSAHATTSFSSTVRHHSDFSPSTCWRRRMRF